MNLPLMYPVACHTDHIGQGSTFVAIQGFNDDGVRFIPRAIAQGATRIVIQQNVTLPLDTQSLIEKHQVAVMRVEQPRLALAQLAAQAAGYPAKQLNIIGITGTKGKTTSAFLMEHLLKTVGYKTALLGTVKNSILEHTISKGLTTEQPDYLHQFFKLCVDVGIDYVVMEVAAQAVTMHRTYGIDFDGIIFTNFYKSMVSFMQASRTILMPKRLFLPN